MKTEHGQRNGTVGRCFKRIDRTGLEMGWRSSYKSIGEENRTAKRIRNVKTQDRRRDKHRSRGERKTASQLRAQSPPPPRSREIFGQRSRAPAASIPATGARSERPKASPPNAARVPSRLPHGADSCFTSWNEGAARIEGYSAREIVGKHHRLYPLS
jgi:hypothetical protein